jgi:DNA ligase-1
MAEYLQQPKLTSSGVMNWWMSEKLEGMRAFWDGGVSRGRLDCPWSTDNVPATGLWSRYGKVIHAPAPFLDSLPRIALDGELWLGHGLFEQTISVVKRKEPDSRWEDIQYRVFEAVPWASFAQTRRIRNNIINIQIQDWEVEDYITGFEFDWKPSSSCMFRSSDKKLRDLIPHMLVKQEEIADLKVMNEYLDDVMRSGGEGLIIRDPHAIYTCNRTDRVLKLKPTQESTAIVVGYTSGKGKYDGMLGALIVEDNGVRFELSGMDDAMRETKIPIGTKVWYRYRSVTANGKPSEARYIGVCDEIPFTE